MKTMRLAFEDSTIEKFIQAHSISISLGFKVYEFCLDHKDGPENRFNKAEILAPKIVFSIFFRNFDSLNDSIIKFNHAKSCFKSTFLAERPLTYFSNVFSGPFSDVRLFPQINLRKIFQNADSRN